MSDNGQGTEAVGTSEMRVLLVGVNDYSAFDATGGHDLRGSRSSAVLMAWYCVEVLGVKPANVRLLTSPAITDEERRDNDAIHWACKLDASCLGEATADEVRKSVDTLLAHSGPAGALFGFAGHGSWTSDAGPVLCMGDADGALSKGVLPLRELRATIEKAQARGRVVAVLDCCHAAAPSGSELSQVTSLPHRGTAADLARDDADFDVSDRVLLASLPGTEAHQMRLGMHAHGALSFALVTAAERWHARGGASDGSYGNVLDRATSLLGALGITQTPMLRAPSGALGALRSEPFMALRAGATELTPDALGRHVQIDPANIYTIALKDSSGASWALATVVATPASYPKDKTIQVTLGSNGSWSAPAGRECWYVNTKNLGKLSDAGSSLVVTKVALAAGDSVSIVAMASSTSSTGYSGLGGSNATSAAYFKPTEVMSVGWQSTSPSYTGTKNFYKGGASSPNLWSCFDVTGTTLNQVVWLYIASQAPSTTVDPVAFSDYSTQGSSGPTLGTYFYGVSS